MPWNVVRDGGSCGGDKPWAVIKESDGSTAGCHATEGEARDQQSALYAQENNASSSSNLASWEGVVMLEGVQTGDHREFQGVILPDASEMPMTLGWEKERAHSSLPISKTVAVGRVDTLEKRTGGVIWGTGVIDLDTVDGKEAARLLGNGIIGGVSINGDDPNNGLIEYVYADNCDLSGMDIFEMDEAEFMRCMEPVKVVYNGTRIRALDLVDVPAFIGAKIHLVQSDSPILAAIISSGATEIEDVEVTKDCGCDGTEATMADIVEALTSAAYTITIPDLPPADWYNEPTEAPPFGAITVTAEGRVYGYLAPRNVAHRGFADKRVTVPTGNVDYSKWMNREALVAGGRVAAGAITMDCGHFSPHNMSGPAAAMDHYDNSCSIVATARIGENTKGVWIAGSLMPDVTASQVARLLACQLSGDWRPHREKAGKREFCAALAVPAPGFAMSNTNRKVMMEDGELVASASPVHFDGGRTSNDGRNTSAIVTAAGILARSVGRDPVSRARAIAAIVKGS